MGTLTSKNISVEERSGVNRGIETQETRYTMEHQIEELLKKCGSVKKPSHTRDNLLKDLIRKSDDFPIEFPIDTIRCKTLQNTKTKEVLENNIKSTYPVIHEEVLKLYCMFLIHKRAHGSSLEKELYKDMSVVQLVDRMLTKRAVTFVGVSDYYTLISGKKGYGGWEAIGTADEKDPLTLKHCMSYDELKLSALLYLSGHTVFINDGSRMNKGVPETDSNKIETNGVIIGLIGTRLPKANLMEFQELVITETQNTNKNGYGVKQTSEVNFFKDYKEKERTLWRKIWSRFYDDEPMLTYGEVMNLKDEDTSTPNYLKKIVYSPTVHFNNSIYSKHLRIPFDCSLLEANHRGEASEKYAYLHIVGIGLGVWRAFKSQDSVFVKTILERIKELVHILPKLSDVHLAYMKDIPTELITSDGLFVACESHPKGGIQVHLSNREPSSKFQCPHEGKLIVETYAWDGNALPGNEFWSGGLHSSGDPAAACSTQVSELHNGHINTTYVCGNNLHVIGRLGVHHLGDYVKLMMEERPL